MSEYNKDVLAIVVTYNRLALLKENIEALHKVRGKPDILVIDNHSSDGTGEYLQKKNIDHVSLNENIGGAGGFAKGIKEAVLRNYKYVWIMDDDTIPAPNSLSSLKSAADIINDKFGFLCSYVSWIDGNSCIMNEPELLPSCSNLEDEYFQRGIVRCKRASFVSMFIKTETVKQVGLPIKEFFIWGDDVEYSNRLSDYETSYFVSKSIVLHKMKSNTPTSIIEDDDSRLDRYYYLYRNQTYMARKKGGRANILNMAYIFYQIVKILRSKATGKFKRIRIILKGWNKGLFFNPIIEYVS